MDQRSKYKNLKLQNLQKKTQENSDLEVGKDFLNMAPKAQAITEKNS